MPRRPPRQRVSCLTVRPCRLRAGSGWRPGSAPCRTRPTAPSVRSRRAQRQAAPTGSQAALLVCVGSDRLWHAVRLMQHPGPAAPVRFAAHHQRPRKAVVGHSAAGVVPERTDRSAKPSSHVHCPFLPCALDAAGVVRRRGVVAAAMPLDGGANTPTVSCTQPIMVPCRHRLVSPQPRRHAHARSHDAPPGFTVTPSLRSPGSIRHPLEVG
jgi:hypothetical protein